FLLPVGAAAVVLSAMVALVLVPANPSTVVDLGGQFELVRRGVVQDPGGMQRLVAGDLIVALEEAAAELKFEDDTQIRLAPGAEVIFEPKLPLDEPVSRGLDLLRGSLEATVSPQPGAQRFVVNTPHAAAVVRGTRFTLEVGKRQTRLQVQEGRVDLIHHPSGKVTKVVAGKSAIARPASSSLRSRKGLLAYYTFQTGAGEMVKDRSDFQSPLPLYLTGPDKKTVSWLGYQGMSFPQQARLQSAPGKKIVRACRSSGELGIEVWMKPGRSFQGGPAPIISMAQGRKETNFALIQQGRTYVARTLAGESVSSLKASAFRVREEWTHLVLGCSADGERVLWINGKRMAKDRLKGDFEAWSPELRIALADDLEDGGRHWQGSLRLVAFYSRVLSEKDVARHYSMGPTL
ncbi:MAG: FecR domain-containing protein, partial [Verrucomicrobiota bacterium]